MDPTGDDRFQRSQSLEGRVTNALITGDYRLLECRLALLIKNRCHDWTDFPIETSLFPGQASSLLGHQSERFSVGTRDAATLSDALGGEELVGHIDVPRRRATDADVGADVCPQADPAHRLNTACNADIN